MQPAPARPSPYRIVRRLATWAVALTVTYAVAWFVARLAGLVPPPTEAGLQRFLQVAGVVFVTWTWIEVPRAFGAVAPAPDRAPDASPFRPLQIAGGLLVAFEGTLRLVERFVPSVAASMHPLPSHLGTAAYVGVALLALVLAARHARARHRSTRSFAVASAALGSALLVFAAMNTRSISGPARRLVIGISPGWLLVAVLGLGAVALLAFVVGLRYLSLEEEAEATVATTAQGPRGRRRVVQG